MKKRDRVFSNMLLREFADIFDINKGDRLYIASELMKLAVLCRKAHEKFDMDELIDIIKEKVGEEGTILIPTFTFVFSNEKHYDYLHSPSTVGALGNAALARDDFKRTKHPMHSFAVWGADKDLLCGMDNKHSFGNDSPFEYCRANHVKQIILGTDYKHGMTFCHYAETACNVPYRFAKTFTGEYTDENGITETRTYDYAARKLEIEPVEKINRIGAVFEEKGLSRSLDFRGCVSVQIDDLGAVWDTLCDDIMNNECRNIYDFNIPREQIFEGWKPVKPF